MNHPPIYTMTFEDLEALEPSLDSIVSSCGYPIKTRDRKWDRAYAYYIWSADVDHAIYRGDITPEQNPKGANANVNIKPVLNKKGRPFSWSHSALSSFESCPWAYAQEKFFCTIQFKETEAIKFGNEVHSVPEHALKGQAIKRPDLRHHVEPYLTHFLSRQQQGIEVHGEFEIVLTRNLKPTSWFSKDAWFRAKLDVLDIMNGKASYYDWKTGQPKKGPKDDTEQLETCLAALGIVRPELVEFQGKLIWTHFQQVTPGVTGLTKDNLRLIWEDRLRRARRMEDAWRTETFVCRPNGLCNGWCQVKDCKHYKG